MAGFATEDPNEKQEVLGLIKAMEKHSYGSSTESVRKLLQSITEKQRVALIQNGTANYVDWIEEMEKSGQKLIIYGI